MTQHKQQVVEFLRSFETGDPKLISYINPERYIQHSLNLGDGLAALEARLGSGPKGSVRANTVRAFEDGELVFTRTEFNFSGNSRIAFDIFRFEDGKIAEHWNTLETIPPRAAWKNPHGKF